MANTCLICLSGLRMMPSCLLFLVMISMRCVLRLTFCWTLVVHTIGCIPLSTETFYITFTYVQKTVSQPVSFHPCSLRESFCFFRISTSDRRLMLSAVYLLNVTRVHTVHR